MSASRFAVASVARAAFAAAVPVTLVAACVAEKRSESQAATTTAASAAAATLLTAPASGAADRIYVGGTIITINDAQPQVEAIA